MTSFLLVSAAVLLILLLFWCGVSFLCPVPPEGDLIYVLTPECAAAMEHTVRGFSSLRRNGLLRARLVVVLDDHVAPETEKIARLLADRESWIVLIRREQWIQWVESEA